MGHSSRRQFLTGTSAALLAAGLPGARVLARPAQGLLRFVFVFAQGGWDPTRVFAAEFGNANVDMEPDAGLSQAGGIPFVDHADRPAVASFLNRWHANTVVFNGLLVRSLAHEVCTRIAMTGSPSGMRSDWAAILADSEREEFLLPSLVIAAPSYPGERGVSVARTGGSGQLGGLLSGDLRDWSDHGQGGPNRPAEAQIDSFLARRVKARALASRSAPERALLDDLVTATDQAAALKGHQHNIDFTLAGGVSAVSELTRQVFTEGISRCVSIGFGNGALPAAATTTMTPTPTTTRTNPRSGGGCLRLWRRSWGDWRMRLGPGRAPWLTKRCWWCSPRWGGRRCSMASRARTTIPTPRAWWWGRGWTGPGWWGAMTSTLGGSGWIRSPLICRIPAWPCQRSSWGRHCWHWPTWTRRHSFRG